VRESTPSKAMTTKFGETTMKRISICDTTEKLVEITAWGQQAEWLESQAEILDSDCVLALKLAYVAKNGDFPARIGMRESTKMWFLNKTPNLDPRFQSLVNELMAKYGGRQNLGNMKAIGDFGGSKVSAVTIGQLSTEINEVHPDLTTMEVYNGQERPKGLVRVINGFITYVKAPNK